MKIKVNVSTEPFFSQQRLGKCILQEQEWAFKKCKDCGRRTLLLKKIRKEIKGERIL